MLWLTGAFAEPERTVTKIATAGGAAAAAGAPGGQDDSGGSTGGGIGNSDSGGSESSGVGNSGGTAGQSERKRKTGAAVAGGRPTATAGSAGEQGDKLVVHVAGAVKDPGIVTLEQGSRVHEAVTAAGGPRNKAQLGAINLAAPVQDGQQLYVPERGEVPANGTAASGSEPATGSGSVSEASGNAESGAEPTPVVNINTADETELSTLPGVGPVLSGRIVDWRKEHGAFGSVAELDAVSGIGEKMMATLTGLVTVSHGL